MTIEKGRVMTHMTNMTHIIIGLREQAWRRGLNAASRIRLRVKLWKSRSRPPKSRYVSCETEALHCANSLMRLNRRKTAFLMAARVGKGGSFAPPNFRCTDVTGCGDVLDEMAFGVKARLHYVGEVAEGEGLKPEADM